MKAVIYARYSPGANQTEQSIEGQIYDCQEFARHNNITIVGTYIDRALSGKSDHRADFLRMIADSETRLFEAVIVWKLDRFARNRYDSAIYKAKLKKNGVKVLSAKENIADTPEGIILEAMLEGMAEYYSANLSQNILRGMRQSALKCQITGGNIALGYKIGADKKFEIDPDTAPTVALIFDMYDAGRTVTEIINHLNEKGFKTSRGVAFNKNSLHRLLKNEKYIGIYRYQDILIENGVPAIVDRALFERVQIKMKKNKKAPARSKAKADYLLSTKCFCGLCGSNMGGESGTGRSQVYYYYKCTKRKRNNDCEKSPVKKDWLENLVVSETVKLLTDDVIELIAENGVKIQLSEAANSPLKSLERQLSEVNKAIKNIITAIEQGVFSDTTKERLNQLEAQKTELEAQIASEKIVKPMLTKEHIMFWLEQFKGGEVDDPDYKRLVIDTFVNSVFVYEDKIYITYNYQNGNKTIDLSDLPQEKEKPNQDGSDNLAMVEVHASYPNLFFTPLVFGISIEMSSQ